MAVRRRCPGPGDYLVDRALTERPAGGAVLVLGLTRVPLADSESAQLTAPVRAVPPSSRVQRGAVAGAFVAGHPELDSVLAAVLPLPTEGDAAAGEAEPRLGPAGALGAGGWERQRCRTGAGRRSEELRNRPVPHHATHWVGYTGYRNITH